MAEEKKGRAHLSQLFKVGIEVLVTATEGDEFPLWVQRPTAVQQDQAREAANARMIRIKQQYEKKEGDRYLTLKQTMSEIETLDDLLDMRVQYKAAEIRDKAFNEVLYGDVGTDWQLENKYLGIITAITDRWDEVNRYNEQMEEAESEERILPDEDEQLVALLEEQAGFQKEVQDRIDEMMIVERAVHQNKPLEQLRNEVVKDSIDTEARLYWYETYQIRMLYYATRDLDDHEKFYFETPEDVLELPTYIRQELFQSYEELERGSEELKNSLSLPSSSA